MALGLSLPADVVLYLLLPMYADQFGVTLAEAGMLLAANRLVRIAGYGFVARFYARNGDRPTCTLAVVAAAVCALGYTTLSGFWALLPLRLMWGLCFAALNLSTQALATADPVGAARRNGRSRAFIAMGPVLALPLGSRTGWARARSSASSQCSLCSPAWSRGGCLRRRIRWASPRGASSGPTASTAGRSWRG